MMRNLLLAGIGGALGSMLRFLSYQLIRINHTFIITLGINIIGSFIIGLVIGYGIKHLEFESNWRVFLATGVCGGFTTFSAFSLENIQLIQQGKFSWALLYITLSLVAGILAAFVGYKLTA